MENKEKMVEEEAKQSEAVTNQKENNNKMIIKIVVGVLIFLTVIILAIVLLFWSTINKVVNTRESIVNTGKSLIDSAMKDFEDNNSSTNNTTTQNIDRNIINNADSNKVAITADEFKQVMETKGYELHESTDIINQDGGYTMKESYVSKKDDCQIEFYELSNISDAIDMYNDNKSKFESQKGGTSSYSTISKSNYNIYNLTTNGKYQYLARVENTLIYVDVDETYKDTVKNIVEELGY